MEFQSAVKFEVWYFPLNFQVIDGQNISSTIFQLEKKLFSHRLIIQKKLFRMCMHVFFCMCMLKW